MGQSVYATTSFIMNIDTMYTCKYTYVIEVRIAQSLNKVYRSERNAVNVPVTKEKPMIK